MMHKFCLWSLVLLFFTGFAVADGLTEEWQWILDDFTKVVPLEENEKLVFVNPMAIEFNQWQSTTDQYGINRAWNEPERELDDIQQSYLLFLDSVELYDELVWCWMEANETYHNLSMKYNETFYFYNTTLTPDEWIDQYDLHHAFRKNISMQRNWNSTFYSAFMNVSLSADSIVRVNVTQAVPWMNMGFLYAYRNARMGNLFSNASYFFDPDTGAFNAITTGVVVSSNVVMNETWVQWGGQFSGNTSTVTHKNEPVTIAYILKQIPWPALCSPCFGSYQCTEGDYCEMCPWRGDITWQNGMCMCSDNGGNCQICN